MNMTHDVGLLSGRERPQRRTRECQAPSQERIEIGRHDLAGLKRDGGIATILGEAGEIPAEVIASNHIENNIDTTAFRDLFGQGNPIVGTAVDG
jgi:hypothetical protein